MRDACISFLPIIFVPHTIPPPTLQSCSPSGEEFVVKGIKLSLSIYLHPLCLCLSPRQLASLDSGWLLTLVSLGCYLSPKQWCWQNDSLFHRHPHEHTLMQRNTHKQKDIVLLKYWQACIFEHNFNQWHLKWGCFTQTRTPVSLGYTKHWLSVLTRTRLIQNNIPQYGWHLTDL